MHTDLYSIFAPPGSDEGSIITQITNIAHLHSASAINVSGTPWPSSRGRILKVQIKGEKARCLLFAASRPSGMKHIRSW